MPTRRSDHVWPNGYADECDRQRRAMTEAELVKLLQVARMRPLAGYGRKTARPDENETEANDSPAKRSNWTMAV